MEQQICVLACTALGETGSLVFALLAFVYALFLRRQKAQTDSKVVDLEAERVKLEAERTKLETEIKVLSLRPPALPAFVIHTGGAAPVITPSTPPPAPPPVPHDEDPFPDERLD